MYVNSDCRKKMYFLSRPILTHREFSCRAHVQKCLRSFRRHRHHPHHGVLHNIHISASSLLPSRQHIQHIKFTPKEHEYFRYPREKLREIFKSRRGRKGLRRIRERKNEFPRLFEYAGATPRTFMADIFNISLYPPHPLRNKNYREFY